MKNALRKSIVLGMIVAMGSALLASPADAASREWNFEVLLDDRKIGYHSFSLSEADGQQVIETEASFDVKLLFITAFKYRHRNTEVWNDGCLRSIDAETDSNGKRFEVKGTATAESLSVAGTNGEAELGDCVRTFAYWDRELLTADRLLNSQTGEYEDVEIREVGNETIEVDGREVEAIRYALDAKGGEISLWYADESRVWLALEAPAKGGRTIRYRAVELPVELGTGA